jgi:hypothetical protein
MVLYWQVLLEPDNHRTLLRMHRPNRCRKLVDGYPVMQWMPLYWYRLNQQYKNGLL